MTAFVVTGFEEYPLTATPADLDDSRLNQQINTFMEINPNWSGAGIITNTNLVDGVGKNLRLHNQNEGLRFNLSSGFLGIDFLAFHVYIATLSAVETPIATWRRQNDLARMGQLVVLPSGQVDFVYHDDTRETNIATLTAGVHYHFEVNYVITNSNNFGNKVEIRLDGNSNPILDITNPPRPSNANRRMQYFDLGFSMSSSSATACHDMYIDNVVAWRGAGSGPFTADFEGVLRVIETPYSFVSSTDFSVVGAASILEAVESNDSTSYIQSTSTSAIVTFDLDNIVSLPGTDIRSFEVKSICRPVTSGQSLASYFTESNGSIGSGFVLSGLTNFTRVSGRTDDRDLDGNIDWTLVKINGVTFGYDRNASFNDVRIGFMHASVVTRDPPSVPFDDFELPHEFNQNDLFTPTIQAQPNDEINIAVLNNVNSLFTPSLANIPDNLTIPGPIASTEQVFAPEFPEPPLIELATIASTNQLFAPEFPQLQFIGLDLLANVNQLFTPTLQVLNLEIPHLDNSLVTQFFTPELENLPPPATNEYAFIFPRSRIFGFEFADIITAQGRIAGIESNPFRPNVPDDVDETLPLEAARYFQNQAELLAQTYDGIQSGTIAFPAQLMRFIDDEPRFPIGAEGLFLHSTLGFMRGVYSQFFETTNAGAPVGISKFDFDKVSGVIENCLPDSVQGLLAAESAGAKDQYGWVLIQGRTMSPVLASSDLNNGDEVGWTFTNQVGALPTTSIIARYRGQRLDQGELVTAGDLYVRRESSTAATVLADIEALQAALGLLDTDSTGLLTNIVAINQSIAGLQNALDDEVAERADSDNALTVTVNQLIAQVESLNDSIITQLTDAFTNADTELQTVLVSVDEDLQSQINDISATIGAIGSNITNLQAESQAASEANLVTINSIYPRSLAVNWFF